jgi:hypothetical protein
MIKKVCKNCIHWGKNEPYRNGKPRFGGECDSEKFVYDGMDTYYNKEPDEDMLQYGDFEGYSADFDTGPEFGCIHFEPHRAREEKDEDVKDNDDHDAAMEAAGEQWNPEDGCWD